MRKIAFLTAVFVAVLTLATTAFAVTGPRIDNSGGSAPVTLAATGPQMNFDNGGGQVPIGSYIARVYIYYDGYWHWLNCQWIVYPWGAFMDHCW